MSLTLSQKQEQQKENKKLLTKAFTSLKKEKFTIVRLSKNEKGQCLNAWDLAVQQLKETDLISLSNNHPNLVICRKIYDSKTNFTDKLILNFNGDRTKIVEALVKAGLNVINPQASQDVAISVQLAD